jgi:antirestriction protein ArdC
MKGKKSKAAQLKDEIAANLEKLTRLTDQARIGEEMKRYLAFAARFHRYSFGNVMLILAQCPHARLVAGYRAWRRMGFQVRRGKKGIGILAPVPYRRRKEAEDPDDEEDGGTGLYFKPVHVFDVSQVGIVCLHCDRHLSAATATHCENCGAELEVSLPGPPQWTDEGREGEGLAARLEAHARSLGIEVVEQELAGKKQGSSELGRVVLSKGLSPLGRAGTLAHELAHEVMHSEEERMGTIPRAVREVEAEAVAYVVCAHFGLSSNAPNYVALWDRDGGILRQRLERVGHAAARIIAAVEAMDRPAVPLDLPAAVGVAGP